MLASNSGGSQDLTPDEQILHHHAAMIQKDIEAYCAYPGGEKSWKKRFKDHLVRFILVPHFDRPFTQIHLDKLNELFCRHP
jgi:hypothetical protein